MRIHSNFNTGYVHIGADEAFQVGICDADREILPVKYDNNKLRMIFDHLRMVSLNITEEYPSTKVCRGYCQKYIFVSVSSTQFRPHKPSFSRC